MRKKFLSAFVLLMVSAICIAQVYTGKFTIKGKVIGIENVKLRAAGFQNTQLCKVVQDGIFFFRFDSVENGEYIYLSLDSERSTIRLLTEIDSVLELTIDLRKWPTYKCNGSTAQYDYVNFFNKIQKPFNLALNDYRTIKQTINPSDSLSMSLSLMDKKYKEAIATYRRETIEWIIVHPNSFFTPDLILRWWPKEDYHSAYEKLSLKVQESYFGKRLKEKIKKLNNRTNDIY